MKREIMEVVAGKFETGHGGFEDYNEFKREYPDFGMEGWEYYCELVNLGPAGFYEEFKDDYDFDPMFVQEYGYEDCDEDEEEEYRFVVRFDEDGQNLDCWCEDREFAIEYAKRHIDCGPVIYEIDEETGVENAILYIDDSEEED